MNAEEGKQNELRKSENSGFFGMIVDTLRYVEVNSKLMNCLSISRVAYLKLSSILTWRGSLRPENAFILLLFNGTISYTASFQKKTVYLQIFEQI